MIQRHASNFLDALARGYPVIAITGPRQSGKTTLARSHFPDKAYVSFENPDVQEMAAGDPRGFLARHRDGAVFDEVQRSPHLISYLQQMVDEDPRPGRFILTGSQQFGLTAGITQSLAGRVAFLELLPFSYAELHGDKEATARPELDAVLHAGSYPPVHDRGLDPQVWYANYMRTYVERDVRQMVQVRDLLVFQRFVRLCAGRIGGLVNYSDLTGDAGISHNTAKAWLSILEASYLVYRLPPHHRNFNKRLVKTPKLYFHDTGLACWLLGIRDPGQLAVHAMRGHLFEGWILGEMLKRRCNQGRPVDLHFWRDSGGHEVDVLLEEGGLIRPVEIKSGATFAADALRPLERWGAIAGEAAGQATLVYGGEESFTHAKARVLDWRTAALNPP